MIQILITVMVAAIILPLTYFNFQATPLPKRMLVAGTIVAAAFISVFLQFLELAFYVPILAIVAISMIGAIVFAKIDETEKAEKRRIAEERKQRQHTPVQLQKDTIEETPAQKESAPSLYNEQEPEKKSFAMQTIGVSGEER
ncbi:hypothetical protein [Metaplanococcus flavidus]|uniref:Uncharacterized protein n=1 Tax=Metaplanococcus flavidus TaxID=569883 RepID=A0ABW3L7A0_9BACL